MRSILLALLTLALYGCTLEQAAMVKQAGCLTTTESGRAEIREKQKIKTNICGDKL